MAIEDRQSNERMTATKLHKQFAHPRAESLKKLVNEAGIRNKKLLKEIDEVSKTCIICLKQSKPHPRPVVCLPLASRFNEIVGIDLKKYGDFYFLVMVDIATRFCQAKVITNKSPNTIIKALFISWISIFGAPRKYLSDNGGEFVNSEIRELSSIFSIRLLTTAAESPWSNGICERLNSTLGNIVSKIMEDSDCGVHIALSWAVAARNAFLNKSGVSPNQLVFGFNPSYPNIYDNSLPASSFEDPSNEIIRKNCIARHKAREIFIRYEANERIRKALRHNVRYTDIEILKPGDEVLYKRNDNSKWLGPAKVAYIDLPAKTVTVNHGGHHIKAHAVSIIKIPTLDEIIEKDNENEDIDDIKEEIQTKNTPNINMTQKKQGNSSNVQKDNSQPVPSLSSNPKINNQMKNTNKATKSNALKIGQRFQGVEKDTKKVITGKIINRAGKVKGSNKDCYNVEKDDGWRGWINMENIQDLQMIPNESALIILFCSYEVNKAKEKEIQKWRDNNVFEEVEDVGQNTISVRWVITEKIIENKEATNARLVARGFEEETEKLKKDSPTCSRESVNFVIFFAKCRNWKCRSMDVKAAYLQGENIKRVVYLRPPAEFDNGYLWKLRKTVYGLCDAARAWYDTITNELIKMGVRQCSLDKSLFLWYNNGELEGIICLYVDDFLFAGSQVFLDTIIRTLVKTFKIGSEHSENFTYVGLRFITYKDGITVDQDHYIHSINEITLTKKRILEKNSELTKKELATFRTLIGQLSWISTHTRPDIAFEVCELGAKVKNATVSDILSINHLVRRLKAISVNLYFPNMSSVNNFTMLCYTDASFRSLPLEGSQAGFIIYIQSADGKKCPLFWQSKKIDRVVDSTLAAEAAALHKGIEIAVYLASVINYISPNIKINIVCRTDCKSLATALESTNQIQHRFLRLKLLCITELMEKDKIKVEWVRGKDQLADSLTKKGKCRDDLIYSICRQ